MKISFVILTWNSQDYIEKCLLSYTRSLTSENVSAEFLVVDNGSKDKTAEILEKLFKSLPDNLSGKIFKLKNNLGTTRSRNIALKQAKGEFIVVCDSDTEFLEGKWQEIIDFWQENPKIGIIAPQLVLEDNSVQNSVKKFPSILDKFLKLRRLLKISEYKGDYYTDFPFSKVKDVETAISAFWMFHTGLLKKIGYLDENIYYAPEDLDFCLSSWQAGFRIVYYPFFKVRHKTQRISHTRPISKIALAHVTGLLYYFFKHKYLFHPNIIKS